MRTATWPGKVRHHLTCQTRNGKCMLSARHRDLRSSPGRCDVNQGSHLRQFFPKILLNFVKCIAGKTYNEGDVLPVPNAERLYLGRRTTSPVSGIPDLVRVAVTHLD